MTFLEKEKEKLEKKLKELEEKEHEEFLNYMDSGEAKYENRRYKAEMEADEITKFLYAQENAEQYKKKVREYENFVDGLKKKIQDLKKEFPAKIYPDVDHILGRVYTYIVNREL